MFSAVKNFFTELILLPEFIVITFYDIILNLFIFAHKISNITMSIYSYFRKDSITHEKSIRIAKDTDAFDCYSIKP